MVMPGIHQLTNTLVMPHIYDAGGNFMTVCVINTSDRDDCVAAWLLRAHWAMRRRPIELYVTVSYLLRNICSLFETALGSFSSP